MWSNLSRTALALAMLMGSQPAFASEEAAESGAAGETIVITTFREASLSSATKTGPG